MGERREEENGRRGYGKRAGTSCEVRAARHEIASFAIDRAKKGPWNSRVGRPLVVVGARDRASLRGIAPGLGVEDWSRRRRRRRSSHGGPIGRLKKRSRVPERVADVRTDGRARREVNTISLLAPLPVVITQPAVRSRVPLVFSLSLSLYLPVCLSCSAFLTRRVVCLSVRTPCSRRT